MPGKTTSDLPKNPFESLAMSMSGGGFRATAFHLGALNLLYCIGLLDKLHMISTVSGGTITGAVYAVNRKQGKPFSEIFRLLYNYLEADMAADAALRVLSSGQLAKSVGAQKLILAFAQAYEESLFAGKKLGEFWERSGIHPDDFHLKEIIFNATEFYSGIAFRFQKSAASRAKIGNRQVSITAAEAKLCRIADIVAASSCFPGGMEPIAFPTEFNWQDLSETERARIEALKKKFPRKNNAKDVTLMDGGIYDNQGIESLLLANERNERFHTDSAEKLKAADAKKREKLEEELKERKITTLFIVSDVSFVTEDIYNLPPKLNVSRSLVKNWVRGGASWLSLIRWGFLLLGVLMTALAVQNFEMSGPGIISVLSGVVLLATGLILSKVNNRVRDLYGLAEKKWQELKKVYGTILDDGWKIVQKLTFDDVLNAVSQRATSVLSMTNTIFMRRIREQGYEELFKHERLRNQAIGNVITDVERASNAALPDWLEPSAALRVVSKHAAEMPTTLWFKDEKARLEPLVKSGSFTLCFQILRYIEQYYPPEARTPEIKDVHDKARKIWEAFNKDPKGFALRPEDYPQPNAKT